MDQSTQPILRLRGGGADQKRKEARKRKFEQLRHEHPIASLIGEAKTIDGPSEQQAPDSSSSSEAAAVPEINRADEAQAEEQSMPLPEPDGHEAEEGNSGPPKSQRFIVFIGILSIWFDLWNED